MHDNDLLTAYVVVQQKSLKDDPHVPRWIKWLLRAIYFRYGWAAVGRDGKSYTKLEFIGVFDDATSARYAAMIPGGSYRELPLNTSLPEGTCQFGVHDFPLSDASPEYRHRELPWVPIARADLNALGIEIENTVDCALGKCTPKPV